MMHACVSKCASSRVPYVWLCMVDNIEGPKHCVCVCGCHCRENPDCGAERKMMDEQVAASKSLLLE